MRPALSLGYFVPAFLGRGGGGTGGPGVHQDKHTQVYLKGPVACEGDKDTCPRTQPYSCTVHGCPQEALPGVYSLQGALVFCGF